MNEPTNPNIEAMTEALEFYADKKNYVTTSTGFCAQVDPEPAAIETDNGAMARKALNKS